MAISNELEAGKMEIIRNCQKALWCSLASFTVHYAIKLGSDSMPLHLDRLHLS